MAERKILRPWCCVLALMNPRRVSPGGKAGMRTGCFLPKERSALARRPPTFRRPSQSSMEGLFDSSSERFLGSSCLMVSRPLGQASDCICLNRYMVASMSLVALFCWASSSAFFQALPEVTSSIVGQVLEVKYDEACVKNEALGSWSVGDSGGLGSSWDRKAGPLSQQEA